MSIFQGRNQRSKYAVPCNYSITNIISDYDIRQLSLIEVFLLKIWNECYGKHICRLVY